jgi:hypothetical protein
MRSSSALFPLFVSASFARTLSLLGARASVIDPAGGSGSPDVVSGLLGPHMLPRRTSPSSNKHDHSHRHRHSHNGKLKSHASDSNATTPVPPAEPVSKHRVNPSPLSQLLSGEPQNEKRVVHGFGFAMGMMKKKGLALRGTNNLARIDGLDAIITHLTIYRDDISGNCDALREFPRFGPILLRSLFQELF